MFKYHLLLDEDFYLVIKENLQEMLNIKLSTVQGKEYKEIEESIFNDQAELFTVLTDIKNKTKMMKNKKRNLENVIRYKQAKEMMKNRLLDSANCWIVCVDVENFELDNDRLLEVGVSILDCKTKKLEDLHFIIKETEHLRNRKYVPDRKNDFMFGRSQTFSLKPLVKALKEYIFLPDNTTLGPREIILLGHDAMNDFIALKKAGLDIDLEKFELFDTKELYKGKTENADLNKSLGSLCSEFDIKTFCLHNAGIPSFVYLLGNDSHFTLAVFLKLCDAEKYVDFTLIKV